MMSHAGQCRKIFQRFLQEGAFLACDRKIEKSKIYVQNVNQTQSCEEAK